jgi:hypothetical protein
MVCLLVTLTVPDRRQLTAVAPLRYYLCPQGIISQSLHRVQIVARSVLISKVGTVDEVIARIELSKIKQY